MFKREISVDRNVLRRLFWGGLCLAAIFATSCSAAELREQEGETPLPHASRISPPGRALMLRANIRAGDSLGRILLSRLGSASGILVATMVDLDDFDKTTPLGRVVMQQISSRLSQHGFKVLEPRLSSTLRFDKKSGEFMLTRESLLLLAGNHDAHAVLVGTYSLGRDRVFLSVRAVRLQDSAVLAAYEYYLPRSDDVAALLEQEASGVAYNGDELWRRYAERERAFRAPPAP
ncbi:MAG: hypothetical protein LBQ63_02810 [Deltaproteobacteria bacterium]|jgi:hypothetical protein|nr:hypothetical protein [Deltaproteobacteria bacterium]